MFSAVKIYIWYFSDNVRGLASTKLGLSHILSIYRPLTSLVQTRPHGILNCVGIPYVNKSSNIIGFNDS